MNKLETITQLLVNELADFEKNVQQLGDQIERAESLRVKFDISPIKRLISQLEESGKRETERRERYLERLERNLKQAKIYPKWAIVSFISMILICCINLFYTYSLKIKTIEEKKVAYANGKTSATKYFNLYLSENPKALELYKKWEKEK